MEVWIGPVIVAAIVSALVSIAGWFVTFRQSVRLERLRRDEKVHDFQVALRAEIASDLLTLVVADREVILRSVKAHYEANSGYVPVVPHWASNVVFDVVVKEIHVLPGEVIEPVIRYARLRETVARFVDDLRAAASAHLPADRAVLMFSDYFEMLDRLEALAQNAVLALDRSLGVNKPVAVRSTQGSASAPDEASAGERGEP